MGLVGCIGTAEGWGEVVRQYPAQKREQQHGRTKRSVFPGPEEFDDIAVGDGAEQVLGKQAVHRCARLGWGLPEQFAFQPVRQR